MAINVVTKDVADFLPVLVSLLENAGSTINNDLPSVWIEQNIVLSKEMSGKPGKLKYWNTPHTREIVDHWSKTSTIHEVVIMKSAQSALTKSAILAGLIWMAVNDPGPSKLLVGHNTLLEAAGIDLDAFIDGADIRHMIRSSSKRSRQTKSGDTNTMKEFAGGSIALGLTNMDSLRQISLKNIVLDDLDAMTIYTKKDGHLDTVVGQRLNAFTESYKLFKVSTPTIKGQSNIESAYLRGDQRKWHIPCPCCHDFIVLEWSTTLDSDPEQRAGIVWEVDDSGNLIPESVGYKCQKCAGVFDDSEKMNWLNAGKWVATAVPKRPDLASYHFNALASPTFMHRWKKYVYDWVEYQSIDNQVEREQQIHSFYNLVLGLPYAKKKRRISASKLQNNIRRYDIGTIPEKLSLQDGNGPIVLVTCALDLGGMMNGINKGTRDDVRIDWEVKAYAASGQSYSVDQGSFGTFVRRDKDWRKRQEAGEMKTYKHGVLNSVWNDVSELLNRTFVNDNTEKDMKIFLMGIDSGHFTEYVYTFVEDNPGRAVALKGLDDEETKIRSVLDFTTWQKGKSRSDLFMVRTHFTKDIISNHVELEWDKLNNEKQPFGFMNFPIPKSGKYLKTTFFDHYESEEKIEEKGKYVWKKIKDENHFFDVAVYNEAVKDIFVHKILDAAGSKEKAWDTYVKEVKKLLK
jgi:phage terminase large subunit GpA-like protein